MAHYLAFVSMVILSSAGYSHGNVKMPEECVGQSYCDVEPEGYNNLKRDFDRYIQQSQYWSGFSTRNNADDSVTKIVPDQTNCGYRTTVIKPFIIRVNETDPVNKIVIQSGKFQQKISTTKCLYKEQSCFEKLTMQQNDIVTSCKERYSTITLYVYEKGVIRPQPFPIAVSCVCSVQFGKRV